MCILGIVESGRKVFSFFIFLVGFLFVEVACSNFVFGDLRSTSNFFPIDLDAFLGEFSVLAVFPPPPPWGSE